MLENTVLFLPTVDRPSARKAICMVEVTDDCRLAHFMLFKPAVEMFAKIRAEAPLKKIVIDIGSKTGRNFLSRVSSFIPISDRGQCEQIYLTQAFEELIECPRERIVKIEGRNWLGGYINIAQSSHLMGGLRQITANDLLLADIVTKVPKNGKLTAAMAKKLYAHPLCFALQFLTKLARQFQGAHTRFDAKILESDMLQFARLIGKMWQSPFFSKSPLKWHCFIEGSPGSVGWRKSSLDVSAYNHKERRAFDSFQYSMLSCHSRTRNNALGKRPLLGELILTADRLAKMLQLEFYEAFKKGTYDSQYDRVYRLIDFAVWTWSNTFGLGELIYPEMEQPAARQLQEEMIALFYEKQKNENS